MTSSASLEFEPGELNNAIIAAELLALGYEVATEEDGVLVASDDDVPIFIQSDADNDVVEFMSVLRLNDGRSIDAKRNVAGLITERVPFCKFFVPTEDESRFIVRYHFCCTPGYPVVCLDMNYRHFCNAFASATRLLAQAALLDESEYS